MEDTLLRIKQSLDQLGISYKVTEHVAAYTSEQAAGIRNVELKTGVKALVCKSTEGKFLLVLARADRKADLKKIARLEGTKKVHLATPNEVLQATGCEIGSIPPFGHANPLKVYFDQGILDNE
ncbi:MAG: hypothetical protein HY519_04195, partial [Candidatus Aenigmarchaeota archaeon]|nr:hypothetical protein [Candidatus Aenigmarchaeota archaeon]